ncbi:3-isopropylmalate dehydratase large subunit [Billgrantia endophytica]|uniref:3-isopropylmalate dehydratase large subunit n=1 Tax=Billgrantia endophytica TaxID=2033802 RepID=A0A2N7TZH4_9GAMM|nr:3-isopropylmalate dehydratase large subunit [Halomonas endophytica]PMR73580.1 3-isopropylmalate dehydratase large subunit [Halomonas endophytica]
MGRTLFDKIWESHIIAERENGMALLFIDRHLVHDATAQAFDQLRLEGKEVRRPELTFGMADHYIATHHDPNRDPVHEQMVTTLAENAHEQGITSFGAGDEYQGIVHVAGPELGLTLPGALLVCGDSHTSTHGALGALAFGIGASEVTHVLATQTLWQQRPKTMRIRIDGELGPQVSAKDLILTIISTIGANGGTGYVIEYTGKTISDLSIESRLTLCNMSIEAGARAGMIAPDETTFSYLKGKRFAPQGELFEHAVEMWRGLKSDDDASYDKEVAIDAGKLAPTVTWGNSPETALPITGHIPSLNEIESNKLEQYNATIEYMGLAPGAMLTSLKIDQVFIGSCTNSRLEDLREAAEIAKLGSAKVPTIVVPGSQQVRQQAEKEGLHEIFQKASFEWREPGCSMCVAMNGDSVPSGARCASTSNRNFAGRQGPGSRTHLMSPAMAAAAAITGHLTDVRELEGNIC